jgi:hypothetical protein
MNISMDWREFKQAYGVLTADPSKHYLAFDDIKGTVRAE